MVILLAEDDLAVQAMVSQVLTIAGYNVITASDGRAALERSRQYAGVIDLLLTDLDMPHLDGIALAAIIREERPNIRLLLTSGGCRLESLRLIDIPMLAKPFSPVSLCNRVSALIGAPSASVRSRCDDA